MEHRPQTSCFHPSLSCALLPTSDQFHPCWLIGPWHHHSMRKRTLNLDWLIDCCVISFSTSLRHVFLGLPTLRWPCGFHLRACFAMQSSDFLNVCPIQFHHFLLSTQSTDSMFALFNKFSICTFSHHRILKLLRSPFVYEYLNIVVQSLSMESIK